MSNNEMDDGSAVFFSGRQVVIQLVSGNIADWYSPFEGAEFEQYLLGVYGNNQGAVIDGVKEEKAGKDEL